MDESDQDSLVTNFEIIFPSLLREAQSLHLGLPYDLPYVHLLQTKRQEKLAAEYVPSLHEYLKNGITSIGQRIPLSSVVLLMEGQLVAQEVLENEGRRDLIGLNCIIARLADDIQTYKAEKAHGELASYIECYMKDHLECIEEEAMNCIYGILEPTVKEVTRDFLKPERDCTVHIPFTCKKILFDETRVTSVMLKDGDGFGISKIQVMEYIKECLTEPLPIVLSQLKG